MGSQLNRALDILAGAAGQEMEKARQFEEAQKERVLQLAQMNKQFELQEKKLKLETDKFKHDESQDLVSLDIEDLARISQAKAARQKEFSDIMKLNVDAEESLQESWSAGLQGDALKPAFDNLNKVRDRAGMKPVDAEMVMPKPPEEPIDIKDEANLLLKFQKEATNIGKDYQVVENNLLNIVSSYNRFENQPENDKNKIAIQQAIITSWNKITDPTSVVRESEYERTPQGAAWLSRMKGAFERISQGGSLPKRELREIKEAAEGLAELRRTIINEKLEKQIRTPGRRYGLIPDEIAPLFKPASRLIRKKSEPTLIKEVFGADSDTTRISDGDKYLESMGYPK